MSVSRHCQTVAVSYHRIFVHHDGLTEYMTSATTWCAHLSRRILTRSYDASWQSCLLFRTMWVGGHLQCGCDCWCIGSNGSRPLRLRVCVYARGCSFSWDFHLSGMAPCAGIPKSEHVRPQKYFFLTAMLRKGLTDKSQAQLVAVQAQGQCLVISLFNAYLLRSFSKTPGNLRCLRVIVDICVLRVNLSS
jgi:hypothetical protein